MMTRRVEVRTGARLHFGLFGTKAEQGRPGGIGLMIDRPGFVLQASQAERDQVIGPRDVADRIAEFVARVRLGLRHPAVRLQVAAPQAAVRIQVRESIPLHRGFGSGTQLAYAVAAAMGQVLDVWPPFVPEKELGRGRRSAVGSAGFRQGGFLIDPGAHDRGGEQGCLHQRIPADWRFVVIDPQGRSGPSGVAETAGFRSLLPMPAAMSDRLFDHVTRKIVPGLSDADFEQFAAGVAAFNRLVGEHFAPAQGGVYAHPLIRELSCSLAGTSWPHLAQSSWGPTAAVFCENQAAAEALVAWLNGTLPAGAANVFVVSPKNDGAVVTDV